VVAKSKKSRRRKLLIWLSIDLAVAAVVIALLAYKPSRYNPTFPAAGDPNGRTVHPYLHRDLGATFYNNVQERKPFEMVVIDQSLNEAISQMKWPREAQGVTLTAPQVLFTPGLAILMGTAEIEGAKFVATIELTPRIDEQGRLSFTLQKFKVGAMNVTPLAKMMGRKMYREQLDSGSVDLENLGTKVMAALLNDEPFDPVVEVDDKSVRLTGVSIAQGQLTAQFAPAKKPR
jgi:hypothetical protein